MFQELYNFLLSTVGPYHFHVWSLIVYATFCFFVFIKTIKYMHPIYAFMFSYVLGMLGNNLYESLWQYIMYETGVNSYYAQYLIVDFALIVILVGGNYIFKFLHINKLFILLLFVELSTFALLGITGHYSLLRIWLANGYIGIDPHNWLWMINKALGVWFLYPLVLSKKQQQEKLNANKQTNK